MLEILDIDAERDINLGQIRSGSAEYRYLTHVWYYGSIPPYKYYSKHYDRSKLAYMRKQHYRLYVDKTLSGKYGFVDYDERLILQAMEEVLHHHVCVEKVGR